MTYSTGHVARSAPGEPILYTVQFMGGGGGGSIP